MQSHTHTMVQKGGGGGGWDPSLEFLMCCSISKRILPSVESLWSSLQDEVNVYFMGGGAAGDL